MLESRPSLKKASHHAVPEIEGTICRKLLGLRPPGFTIQWKFGLNKSARLFFWGGGSKKHVKHVKKTWFSVDFHANPIH